MSMVGVVSFAPAAQVGAVVDPVGNACSIDSESELCKNKNDSATDVVGDLVNAMLFIVGALSVIMIIVAGIMYVTSAGNANRVSQAKNTLTYAIVGVVVAMLAYAVVNWVVKIF